MSNISVVAVFVPMISVAAVALLAAYVAWHNMSVKPQHNDDDSWIWGID